MSKTKLPSVEELLETKNWKGLTVREHAKAGRIGDTAYAARNIVKNLEIFDGPYVMGLDDMVWDLIDELRGLEDDLAAELKRLSEEKKPASREQVFCESITDTNIQIGLISEENGFPEIKDSRAYRDLMKAWSECQREIEKHYRDVHWEL